MIQWFRDLYWAWNMFRIRRIRRNLIFSKRVVYDRALRPHTLFYGDVQYPDAFYLITRRDMTRAAIFVKSMVP